MNRFHLFSNLPFDPPNQAAYRQSWSIPVLPKSRSPASDRWRDITLKRNQLGLEDPLKMDHEAHPLPRPLSGPPIQNITYQGETTRGWL